MSSIAALPLAMPRRLITHLFQPLVRYRHSGRGHLRALFSGKSHGFWVSASFRDLRRAVYGHLLELSPAFFEVTRSGDIPIAPVRRYQWFCKSLVGSSISTALRNCVLLIGGVVDDVVDQLAADGIRPVGHSGDRCANYFSGPQGAAFVESQSGTYRR